MSRVRMQWHLSNRADPAGAALADQHYSRGKPGTSQFVQAAKCLVLVRPSEQTHTRYPPRFEAGQLKGANAVWVTTWPFAEYVRHQWCGPFPTENTVEVVRLLKVDPVTGEAVQSSGHKQSLPRGFVKWDDDEIDMQRRGGILIPVRRAVVQETPGTWNCAIFRNESGVLSSHLIRQAVAATRAHWGDPPPLGMVTMIERDSVRSGGTGRSFLEAGFELRGVTQSKPFKNVFILSPENMPPARRARGDSTNRLVRQANQPGGEGSSPSPRSNGHEATLF